MKPADLQFTKQNLKPKHQAAILLFCVIGAMVLSAIDRTDANWDLRNYHIYGPYAAINNRLGLDYFAAGFQGYFNPTLDIPYYFVRFVLFPNHPLLVALLAGIPFGLLVFCVFNIARELLPHPGYWVWVAAVLLGITGSTTLSEVGTTYDDIPDALLVLFALWNIVQQGRTKNSFIIAGFLTGCAVGLKMTAAVYLPGFVMVALITAPSRRRIFYLFLSGAFSALGFFAVWGWWGLVLWRHFHNPLFPMLSFLFPSHKVPGLDIRDLSFLPRYLLQWLFYPFFWLQGRSFIVAEVPIRDPRFAVIYVSAGLAFISGAWRNFTRPLLAVYVFVALGYVFWLAEFSIIRYLIPLEVLSGVVIWSLCLEVFKNRRPIMILMALTVFCIAFTKPMGWGRIDYSKSLVSGPLPALPKNAIVFTDGAPLGFLVPKFNAPSVAFISLAFASRADEMRGAIKARVISSPDVFLLTNLPPNSPSTNAHLAAFGEFYTEQACTHVSSPVDHNIRLCRVEKLP